MTTKVIYVQNGNNRIYGEMFKPEGNGPFPLVIYSHGYGYNYEEYSMENLAKNGIAAYRFDFCGGSPFSRSDGKSTDMSVITEASDLEAVFDELKQLSYIDEAQIYLSGNSQGGFVSTIVGINRGDEVKGLFLLCPAYTIIDFNRTFGPIHGITHVINMDISERYAVDAENYDLYNEMKKYDGPVIIYHGTRDEMVPLSYSKRAIENFPDAQLVTLKGAGHSFGYAYSSLVEKSIIEHIKG